MNFRKKITAFLFAALLGGSLFQKAAFADHQKHFDKANSLEDQGKLEDADAYYDKGVALEKLSRYKEARIAFDLATKLNPNNIATTNKIKDWLLQIKDWLLRH
ncbi:MAG: tetratricopeptide repeat protein [Pseudomonadota bacterium]